MKEECRTRHTPVCLFLFQEIVATKYFKYVNLKLPLYLILPKKLNKKKTCICNILSVIFFLR
ncbi:hypothetical protein CEH03_05315 [Streptococcus pyogenes]|nr:hypothetical protein MGAS1882_1105 [Streptococcus pyogenes MGAS1882]ASQ23338.1 hypothetical protein B5D85_06735 [Streptococcus pyogenes]OUI71425.1 hypothetical protein B7R59_07540 [Streptococcus pyogenes]OUI76360.1 hypothetical protein B7R61_06080 [Streptococcus pyogenes]PMD80354.1 hypothetical protein CEH03_05315 [Streptococcus pyogenes]